MTGPAAVTATDIAALASVLGRREVEVVHVDDAGFADGLRATGLPEQAVDLVTSFGAAIRGGYLGRVADTVGRLAGRPPTPFAAAVRPAVAVN